jgi:hypothetical protein
MRWHGVLGVLCLFLTDCLDIANAEILHGKLVILCLFVGAARNREYTARNNLHYRTKNQVRSVAATTRPTVSVSGSPGCNITLESSESSERLAGFCARETELCADGCTRCQPGRPHTNFETRLKQPAASLAKRMENAPVIPQLAMYEVRTR